MNKINPILSILNKNSQEQQQRTAFSKAMQINEHRNVLYASKMPTRQKLHANETVITSVALSAKYSFFSVSVAVLTACVATFVLSLVCCVIYKTIKRRRQNRLRAYEEQNFERDVAELREIGASAK